MATQRQKTAVKELAEKVGTPGFKVSMGQVMKTAGYSVITSRTPSKLTESKGFKELCDEAGLTKELILKALADDIIAKPRDRSKELGLASKVLGLVKPDIEQHTVNNIIGDEMFKQILEAYRGSNKAS